MIPALRPSPELAAYVACLGIENNWVKSGHYDASIASVIVARVMNGLKD